MLDYDARRCSAWTPGEVDPVGKEERIKE